MLSQRPHDFVQCLGAHEHHLCRVPAVLHRTTVHVHIELEVRAQQWRSPSKSRSTSVQCFSADDGRTMRTFFPPEWQVAQFALNTSSPSARSAVAMAGDAASMTGDAAMPTTVCFKGKTLRAQGTVTGVRAVVPNMIMTIAIGSHARSTLRVRVQACAHG